METNTPDSVPTVPSECPVTTASNRRFDRMANLARGARKIFGRRVQGIWWGDWRGVSSYIVRHRAKTASTPAYYYKGYILGFGEIRVWAKGW